MSAITERARFVSRGAGVHSSALLVMLDTGALPGPRPQAARLADTHREPAAPHEVLDSERVRELFDDLCGDVPEHAGRLRASS